MSGDGSAGTGCWGCRGFLGKLFRRPDSFLDEEREFTLGGKWGCLRFLGELFKRSDSFLDEEREFLLGGERDGSNGYSGRGCHKPAPLAGVNHAICREFPVKETTKLVRTKDAYGQKMINEYVRECNIGRGSYAKVVLYRSNNDGKQYAIKAFYKSRLAKVRVTSSETAMTDVRREVSIMKLLEHPNIIDLKEVIDDPESDHFYMVLEYVDGKWICDASGTCGGIEESTSRRYLRDIISGLMYLHAHDVVHGDIKPENLLVTKNGTAKIGDFSVSHVFEDGDDVLVRSPGTPVFTAPECCSGVPYHGKAADVWAVGITLYCMALGHPPYIGECLHDTYDKIVDNPLYLPDEMDPELKSLLKGLLCKDPRRRLTLDSAASHPWVVREDGPVSRTPCRCKISGVAEKNIENEHILT